MANLGFDFDGVIVDTKALESRLLLELYCIEISPENLRWEIAQERMSRKEYNEFKFRVYDSLLGMRLEPINGSLEYIKKLSGEDHKIKIVTQRFQEELNIPTMWLRGKGFDFYISYTSLQPKIDECRGLDLFVDDTYEVLEGLGDIVPNLIFFTTPRNQNVEIKNSRIIRVNNWGEVYSFIRTNLK